MKNEPNGRAQMPRNLIFPRTELVYLPVTPEVARAVETAVQMSMDNAGQCPGQRRSAAGRAVLHARGVSLPGVEGMNRGVRCHRPVQTTTSSVTLTKDAVSVTAEAQGTGETPNAPLKPVTHPTIKIGT